MLWADLTIIVLVSFVIHARYVEGSCDHAQCHSPGGTCSPDGELCYCSPDYSGANCQTQITPNKKSRKARGAPTGTAPTGKTTPTGKTPGGKTAPTGKTTPGGKTTPAATTTPIGTTPPPVTTTTIGTTSPTVTSQSAVTTPATSISTTTVTETTTVCNPDQCCAPWGTCSYHNTFCWCNQGYYGNNCHESASGCSSCSEGEACDNNGVCEECYHDCGYHGICTSSSEGVMCKCVVGWTGNDCSTHIGASTASQMTAWMSGILVPYCVTLIL